LNIVAIKNKYLKNYDLYEKIIKPVKMKGQWIGEIKLVEETGQVTWERVIVNTVKDEMGIIKQYIITAQDISYGKQVESGFKNCKEHYNCIYQRNHLITILIDPESGDIIDANNAALRFYGYKAEQFKQMNISEINMLTKEKVTQILNSIKNSSSSEKNNSVFNLRHKLSSGEIKDVEVHTGLINMIGRETIYSVIHDVSDRVRADKLLKESEERYRDLVELCPDAILVCNNGNILYANRKAAKLLGVREVNKVIGSNIEEFLHQNYFDNDENQKIQYNIISSFITEQKFVRYDGAVVDFEISAAPIIYKDMNCVQMVLRDVTDNNRELERAVQIQEHRQQIEFPIKDKVNLEKIYVPAKLLSGDFYLFHKVNSDKVIGIIGDVTGKGITAALNISAAKVLFYDGVMKRQKPIEILNFLNNEAMIHLGEDYVAVCCYSINFEKNEINIAGAGINEFIYIKKDGTSSKCIVKGPPLGMFRNSIFDEKTIKFSSGDRFCFYSDGMEFIFDEDMNMGELSSTQLRSKLKGKIDKIEALEDDCTWICLDIK
jgi:PAS domain S-box-containing protein